MYLSAEHHKKRLFVSVFLSSNGKELCYFLCALTTLRAPIMSFLLFRVIWFLHVGAVFDICSVDIVTICM